MAQIEAPAPLSDLHDVSGFDCGEAALDEWLKSRAIANQSRYSRTYVIAAGSRVVGYYALAAGGVERSRAPGKLQRNAPDAIPVSILARLAVDRGFAGQGLGADLLADALRRVALAAQHIGIGAVVVQAQSDRAKAFYLRCAEFIEFPRESRMLFLPIETVLAGIGEI